ncbi:transmembrane protein 132E isoform X2 [Corvus cornix cornix]|uniref:transmembrane protein 132E isoform X2 n=1 Tax=Corvus cornix cornix TaxID=932674 RepID=UPI00194E31A5|nr:transmembrane protein 132E isoform X2 [Corvus cornix cornix]
MASPEKMLPGPAALLCCLCSLLLPAHAKSPAPSPEPAEPPGAILLPVSYRLSNTRLAFFLKELGASPAGNGSTPLQRSEPFVVFQTKELPVLNVTLGPFSTGLVLPKEHLQPSSTLEVPDRLTVNWKVRAFIVQPRLVASQPVVQVLFYVAGRDWDDFDVTDRLPCVRLHAFRDARELKSSCRLRGSLAMCLVQAELPHAWFGPSAVPLGRRKSPESLEVVPGESQQAELYYTLHAPDGAGQCLGDAGARRGAGGARTEGPTQHPLLRIGSVSLLQPPPAPALQEHHLDGNVFIRLPDKPLKPGEVLSILLYLMSNSTVEHFTLRVKAKKGVNLLSTKSRSGQWLVSSELLTGGKHSTATVDVSRADGAGPRDGDSSSEIMQLDFEMENFTSQSVTRRIMWHIDYRGRNPPPDLEKVVTELTVIQRDIRAIVPLAMDTEIINTAILTGRTVAIPVKVIAIELSGVIVDVSAMVECKSNNEDIIKVSSSCDYVFVSGKESRGSMSARVTFNYEHLSAPLEMTVWVPKLPLHIELSDARLSQVKGWRVPILPDRRSVRDSEHEEDEEERKQSRGCALQYQHSTLQVFTQFHTTAAEGTGQVVTMLGPDWLVEVTDLVSDFMRVDDPRVAHMVDSSTLAGREPGTTLFKVVSPLVEAVLGETLVTVAEEKVSITDLKAQVVSSLSLSLHPSPGNSHTIIARTSVQQTLSFFKQRRHHGAPVPLRPQGLQPGGEQPGREGGVGDPGPGVPLGGGGERGRRGAAAGGAGHLRELPEDQAQERPLHGLGHRARPFRVRGGPHLRLRPHAQQAGAGRGGGKHHPAGRGGQESGPKRGQPDVQRVSPHRGLPHHPHRLRAGDTGADGPGDRDVRPAGRLLSGHLGLPHQLHRLCAEVPAQAHPAGRPDQHGPFPPLGLPGQWAALAGSQ